MCCDSARLTPLQFRFCKNRAMITSAIRSVLAFLRFANTHRRFVLPLPSYNRNQTVNLSENWWKMAIVCHFDLHVCVTRLAKAVRRRTHIRAPTKLKHTRARLTAAYIVCTRKIATHPFVRAQNEFSFDFSDVFLTHRASHTHQTSLAPCCLCSTASFIRCRNLFRLTIDLRPTHLVYQLFYVHRKRDREKLCARRTNINSSKN